MSELTRAIENETGLKVQGPMSVESTVGKLLSQVAPWEQGKAWEALDGSPIVTLYTADFGGESWEVWY